MCGRFALNRGHLAANVDYAYNVQPDEWIDRDNFEPRHNIAPRSNAPVLRRDRPSPAPSDSASASQEPAPARLVLHTMRWGVVPHWTRFDAPNSELKTINARGEALLEKDTGIWNALKKHKRCVVPADGYFEWLAKAPGVKLPHFVRHADPQRCMLLAGLWDRVTLEDGKGPELWTFAIVTVAANEQLGWLHDRMPLILHRAEDVETWLNGDLGWSADVIRLVKPYDGPGLECYQVPKEVGKVGTDSPSYVQPISQRKDGIMASFARASQKKAALAASPLKQPPKLQPGDVLLTQNTDEPPQPEVIEISDSSQPEASSSSRCQIIEIPSSPPTHDSFNVIAAQDSSDVIEILSSPPPQPKRKRSSTDADVLETPTKKRPKPTGKQSPRKKVVEAGKEKGNGKITTFFKPT